MRGTHINHDRPPGGRLTRKQWDAVAEQASRHEEATTFQLRNGDLGSGSVPLAKIAPSLAKGSAACYAVQKSREKQGINTKAQKGAAGVLRSFSDLTKDLSTSFLIDSSISGPVHITMQTPYMRQVLKAAVRSWIADAKEGPEVGRHGFVTDGDHKFFKQGNLLVTAAWCSVTNNWVPVLYSWVDSLDENHHRPHFCALFRMIIEDAGDKFDRKLFANVSHHTTHDTWHSTHTVYRSWITRQLR